MSQNSMVYFLWQSMRHRALPVVGIAGTAASLATLAWKEAPSVKLIIVVVGAAVFLFLVWSLFDAFLRSFHSAVNPLPKVESCLRPTMPYQGFKVLCLLEECDLFEAGIAVTIQIRERNFEKPLGIGTVIGRQQNRKVLVGISDYFPGVEALVDKIYEEETIASLVVRPQFNQAHAELLRQASKGRAAPAGPGGAGTPGTAPSSTPVGGNGNG